MVPNYSAKIRDKRLLRHGGLARILFVALLLLFFIRLSNFHLVARFPNQIMLSPVLLSFALLTSVLALPVKDVALPLHRRQSQPYNSSLPTIAILATGGTIAGSASSAGASTGYAAGSLGIDILLEAVPEM